MIYSRENSSRFLVVWRPSRSIGVLDRHFCRWREPSQHCLARLLRCRHRPSLDRLLLPSPDAELHSVQEGCYQTYAFGLRCMPHLTSHLDRVPYWLVLKRYWKALIGTCGAWWVGTSLSVIWRY